MIIEIMFVSKLDRQSLPVIKINKKKQQKNGKKW